MHKNFMYLYFWGQVLHLCDLISQNTTKLYRLTVCPRSSDPFYIGSLFLGHTIFFNRNRLLFFSTFFYPSYVDQKLTSVVPLKNSTAGKTPSPLPIPVTIVKMYIIRSDEVSSCALSTADTKPNQTVTAATLSKLAAIYLHFDFQIFARLYNIFKPTE